MKLHYEVNLKKKSHKFKIKKITKNDISQKYIESINQSKFLRYNVKTSINKKLQIEYINKINESKNDIIAGIFNKDKIIGTCGAQKKSKKKYYIGIFIFDKRFKGLQLSKIMINFVSKYLKQNYNVSFIYASVNKNNLISHNLFKSLKFKENFIEKKRYKSDKVYFIHVKNLKF
jgi:RimJ/RimL family protein N-acetyltransferase